MIDLQKKYLCLDTCTWIYLANGTEPVKFLHDIRDLINSKQITILLPQIVLEEWNQKKNDKSIFGIVNHTFKGLKKNIKEIGEILDKINKIPSFNFLLNPDEISIKQDFEETNKKLKNLQSSILDVTSKNIKIIDEIFDEKSTVIINITDTIKLEACQMALEKKAPVHKKNGFADALIVLSFLSYVKENNIEHGIFISYNTEDFCVTENKKHSLHSDLETLFNNTKAVFHSTLGRAIKEIEPELVDDYTIELIESMQTDYDDRDVCTECDGYHGYGNEIYFNKPEEVENENKYKFSDNHPKLPFDDVQIVSSTQRKLTDTIQIGYCAHCSTQYIRCQNCEDIIQVEYDVIYGSDDTLTCNCGIMYRSESYFDREIGEITTWKILDDRTKICEGCGEEFIDKLDIGMCLKCEDEYNNK